MSQQQLEILLADDDQDDCLFFKEAITGLNPPANFTAVHDGEQLMQLLNSRSIKLPHILFLDLNMPRKNGFECLLEIKQNAALKGLPVVIFSTSFEQEVVNLLYHNGAQYFLRKPSEFTLFKNIILFTLTLITQGQPGFYLQGSGSEAGQAGDILQPRREDFVITVENSLV